MTQFTWKFLLLYKMEVKRILSVFLHTDEEKKDSLTSILFMADLTNPTSNFLSKLRQSKERKH